MPRFEAVARLPSVSERTWIGPSSVSAPAEGARSSGVDRAEDRFLHAVAYNRHAVATHEDAITRPERLRERGAERTITHEDVVVLAHLANVPNGCTGPDERAYVVHRGEDAS